MKKPSQKNIAAQIAWLEKHFERLPERNGMGENMQAAASAVIKVLKENLSEDQIHDRSQHEDEEEDDSKEWRQCEMDAALDARRWLDGKEDICPEDNFKELIGWKIEK